MTIYPYGLLARLLDSDQGVCPAGHPCQLIGRSSPTVTAKRRCGNSIHDYVGLPLIRLDVTPEQIDEAEVGGVDPAIIEWARISKTEGSTALCLTALFLSATA